jgi:hypothetical protein
MDDYELKKNSEGYYDPTAYEAIKNTEADDTRFNKLLTAMFALCDISDFHIEGRIVVKDKRTGKIYK